MYNQVLTMNTLHYTMRTEILIHNILSCTVDAIYYTKDLYIYTLLCWYCGIHTYTLCDIGTSIPTYTNGFRLIRCLNKRGYQTLL